jgi:phage terminase small subunit
VNDVKLTEKQKRFADIYIECGNATQSYIDAGYKATTRAVAEANARKLLANYSVKKFIEERIAEKDNQRIAKQDEILEFLTKVLRGQIDEEFPLGVGKGEQAIIRKELDGKERLKAAELLGKRYTLWTDKTQLEGTIGVTIVDDIDD